MQIDKKQLRQIADIDIKTFENMIYNAVISSGGNPGQAKAAVMAAPIIKSKLAKANDKELDQLISFIGNENAAKMLNELQNRKKGETNGRS